MRDFHTLKVWERAHLLTLTVYKLTRGLPREELYGLTSQMRRASASIPANIAEGCGRSGNREFHRFLSVAIGSAVELEYFLLLTRDLELISTQSYNSINDELIQTRRMLIGLLQRVATSLANR